MPRAIVLGNGSTLVTLDEYGLLRDFYFPYVGQENHVSGHRHRLGIQVNGTFSWVDDGTWQIKLGYKPETMVGYVLYQNDDLGVSLVVDHAVYNEQNIYLRKIQVYNETDATIELKIFIHQVFLIAENRKRNTAFYDPTHNSLVHYRGRRVFVVNGQTEAGSGIDDFSVGTYDFEGKEGTYRDAEDGSLGKNGVEHGSVDSVARFSMSCEGKKKTSLYTWICAGKSMDEAYQHNQMVTEKTADGMLHSTEQFWNAWLNERELDVSSLPEDQRKLFHTSLFVLRAHTDNRGSIIASADSAMIEYGKDDYAYMWPRDAAFIVMTLDRAGFTEVTRSFFQFCQAVQHPDGYLHHRFNPDQSLGSTWHSAIAQREWLKGKILQLPIQEDETAGVLVALWHHYECTKDIEFIELLFKPFIEKAANFLMHFRHAETGLPLPSYDLWEERIGVSTYTCAAVYGGLQAAAQFCELLGKRNHMREYQDAAKSLKEATIRHLFDPELGAFVRCAQYQDNQLVLEKIVDASSYFGLWYYQLLPQTDPLMEQTFHQLQQRLSNPTPLGGTIRYEHDSYFRRGDHSNPWFITTLWNALARLSHPNASVSDLEFAKEAFRWVSEHVYSSGVLAEQLDPETAESLSATPLVWSHAVYVETVIKFLELTKKLNSTQAPTPAMPPSVPESLPPAA
jgi:oligosaccharide amylase